VNKVPAEEEYNLSHSSLFLDFGAFIGQKHLYSDSLAKGFFKNKYFRARSPNDIHYRRE
jgi:hypothetical protein